MLEVLLHCVVQNCITFGTVAQKKVGKGKEEKRVGGTKCDVT